jgi:hypothetical protein
MESRVSTRLGHPVRPLPDGEPHLQPFAEVVFENNAAVHWQHPTDGSPFAFSQFRWDGDEHADLRAWIRSGYHPKEHPVLYHLQCQESNKRPGPCDLAQFHVRSRLILSDTSGSDQVPFYLQPTLGGSDIENNTTLRGWDDYRFRDRDAALLQFEGDYLVWDPFGIYLFYDAGTVGNKAADLAIGQFRQDAGVGLSARVQGSIVAQTYLAWGRGGGGRWSFNFAKVF